MIQELFGQTLSLNEAKCTILPKSALITEEPDLEALFTNAVKEIEDQLDTGEETSDGGYGFQSEWEDIDEDEEEDEDEDSEEDSESLLELKATELLFDSLSEYPNCEENIERFCLPLFGRAHSDYALDHVIESFKKRPAMAQIYASYLLHFTDEEDVSESVRYLLVEEGLTDWQRMWLLATLYSMSETDDSNVKLAASILKDTNRHDALRAIAAMFIGKFGDHARRKSLISSYAGFSQYVQSAIYYSSRNWPTTEKANARALWGNANDLNRLITKGIQKK